MTSEQGVLKVGPGQASLSRIEVRAPQFGIWEAWTWYDVGGPQLRLFMGRGKTWQEAMARAGEELKAAGLEPVNLINKAKTDLTDYLEKYGD